MSIRLGRVVLPEFDMRPFEEEFNGDRGISLEGTVLSNNVNSVARVAGMHDDLLGMPGQMVPVAFDVKDHRDGYYTVEGVSSSLTQIGLENVLRLAWKVNLVRLGSPAEVDLESRFAGPVSRLNSHTLTGERFHAPPVGHTAYLVGNETPGSVVRTGAEGPIRTYLDLSYGLNPRWQCPVDNYALGRVRVTDLGERAGTGVSLGAAWTLSNSLVRVTPNGDSLDFQWHDGTAWSTAKQFDLTIGGASVGVPVAASIVHNEYERVTLRLLYTRAPSGRVVIDVTLRRGARFVEFVIKSNSSATLGATRTTNEASTLDSGYVRATSDDGDGHRFTMGSLQAFTNNLTAGAISRASTVRMDLFIGAEVDGASAVVGDRGDDLMLQYIGAGSENVQAVKR